MKRSIHMVFVGGFLSMVLLAGGPQALAATAKADLLDAKGESVGAVDFSSGPEGVQMVLSVKGLPPGKHGMHLHSVGQCTAPDFKSAGSHFNPENKKHGLENPEGHHAGDLGNLTVDEDGTADLTTSLRDVTLEEGANSLLQPGGTSLVIHAGADDEKTDPSGNSGDRIVCGVITAS